MQHEASRTRLSDYPVSVQSRVPDAIMTGSNGCTTGQQRVRQGLQRTVGLPLLQIPTFSGRLTDWVRYWENFNVTIHSNASLPRIEKFKYLLPYLTDQA